MPITGADAPGGWSMASLLNYGLTGTQPPSFSYSIRQDVAVRQRPNTGVDS